MTNEKKSEVLQGTLDLMILKTLHALGPQHGFGIARRIEQVSRDVLQLNEGTVYTSLLRLLQRGWIRLLRSGGRPTTTARPKFLLDHGARREAACGGNRKVGSASRA